MMTVTGSYPLYSGLYKSIIQYIDINGLKSPKSPPLPREAVRRMARSVREDGFLRPLYITSDGVISDGRKRFAAAVLCGYSAVPCVTEPTPLVFEDDLLIIKLRERECDFFKEADILRVLTSKYLYSQENVAFAIGKSQSYVANKLRLLAFTDDERELIADGGLTERHCRALLGVTDAEKRLLAIRRVSSLSLSVGATEEYVLSLTSQNEKTSVLELKREVDRLASKFAAHGGISVTSSDGSVTLTIKST